VLFVLVAIIVVLALRFALIAARDFMVDPWELYPCPCCGYLTFDEPTPGTFQICEMCWWHDDDHPSGGANEMSLADAQRNVARYGVMDKGYPKYWRQRRRYERDPNWKPLEP
jgi:hypothetical protein